MGMGREGERLKVGAGERWKVGAGEGGTGVVGEGEKEGERETEINIGVVDRNEEIVVNGT